LWFVEVKVQKWSLNQSHATDSTPLQDKSVIHAALYASCASKTCQVFFF